MTDRGRQLETIVLGLFSQNLGKDSLKKRSTGVSKRQTFF